MVSFLLGILPTIWPYLVAGIGGLAALFFARRSGVKSERAKQAQAELRAREKADEVEDAIAGRSAGENRELLKKRWGRK